MSGGATQALAAALLVLAAVAYLGWRGWRSLSASRRRRTACGTGCGCEPPG